MSQMTPSVSDTHRAEIRWGGQKSLVLGGVIFWMLWPFSHVVAQEEFWHLYISDTLYFIETQLGVFLPVTVREIRCY